MRGYPVLSQHYDRLMVVRGTLTHIHVSSIPTKRGEAVLTSLRVVDDQAPRSHGSQPNGPPTETCFEIQFLDSKQARWSTTLAESFTPGDKILAYVEDSIRLKAVEGKAGLVNVRGIDIGLAFSAHARAAATDV